MITPEAMWERFIEHYARKHGHVEKLKKGEPGPAPVIMKNFLGGIEGYKKAFLEANPVDEK